MVVVGIIYSHIEYCIALKWMKYIYIDQHGWITASQCWREKVNCSVDRA